MNGKHFLLLSLPAQSHINPTLQLAKILTRHGAHVTFATTTSGLRRLNNLPTVPGLSYATFSDGKDQDSDESEDVKKKENVDDYLSTLGRVGPQNIKTLLHQLSTDGSPVNFIVYTVVLPWVAEVARDMHIPSAFLFIQCAIAFTIFHRFFNSHDGLHADNDDFRLETSIKLPNMSLFTSHDIPSFLVPSNEYHSSMIPVFREHIQTLEKDPNPCVLINTFDALEKDFIHSFPGIKLFPIGPLLPSAISDKHDLDDKSFGGHMFQSPTDNYLSWLDLKPDRSVVYVSFGSLMVLTETQKEEILQGLRESGRPFLWVIREIKDEELSSIREKNCISEEIGMIVPWCSQVEVLSHRATGCFVTHCGWNSTLESITSGVPVVGCPSFSEQKTNMKIIEELWGNGIRVKENEEGVFVREEIRRCLDIVMGEEEQGNKIKGNAMKWKILAIEAVKEGGSSRNNLLSFLEK
ncbi:Glycosyltransferase [Heracleum sosnowskyi]|uniref:Glycosyltransferase n=1 Tax=Heracleum sosnowskyi TaxID=360622 RepID=A0AAD8MA77_9APIA|nr:Glycosyltransferase [Heracleum sosnowskyi]